MLKEGLLRLLEQKGLDKIRVNELCAESGINRATFYRHYETAQDVLLELELDFVKQMVPDTRPPKDVEEARARLEYACVYLHDHAGVAKLLFRYNNDADMMRGLNEFYRQFWELRKNELHYDYLDDDTARVIVTMLGGGCYCLLRQWIMEDIPKTPQQIAAIMCNVIHWPTPTDFANI